MKHRLVSKNRLVWRMRPFALLWGEYNQPQMLLVVGWWSLVLLEPSIYRPMIRWHHVLFCCPVFWSFLMKIYYLLLIQEWGRRWYNFFKCFALGYVIKWAHFAASCQLLVHEIFPATYISSKVKFEFHFQHAIWIYLDKVQFLFRFRSLD